MVRKKLGRTIREKEQLMFIGLSFLGFAFLSTIQGMFKFSYINPNLNIIYYSLIGGSIGAILVYKYRALYKRYRTFFISSLGFITGYGFAISYTNITNINPLLAGVIGMVLAIFVFEKI